MSIPASKKVLTIGSKYMSTSKKHILVILLCLIPRTVMAGDPPSLSLESIVLFAMHKNPSIMAEMQKIKEAHFAIDEARADYYPQISMNAKGGHEYDNPASVGANVSPTQKIVGQTNSWSMGLVVTQILYNGWATEAVVGRREALETSATYGSLIAIEGMIQSTIAAYTDVWHYQRNVAESQAFVDSLEKIGNKIGLMNAAGAESKLKKDYVDSRVASAQSELTTAKAALTDALSNLQNLTGSLPPFTAIRPPQLDPTLRPIDSYYDTGRKENNHLLLNTSDHSAVEHQIEEQDAAYMPTVTLQGNVLHGYDVGGHAGNTWNSSAMVVMDYKIFDGFSRDAAEGRLRSQAVETEYRQIQLTRDLDKDIRQYYNQVIATKQDLTSNMKEILSSENLQKLFQQQFELGEGDIIVMIEGAERLHTAKLKSYKLEGDMVVNSYTLLEQVGELRKEKFCATC